jgi:alpha-tubulin suppressor-like RCC1 family protein
MSKLIGRLATWGNGDFGRLGHSNLRSHTLPCIVASLGEQDITEVACGAAHTAAIAADGTAYTFGVNDFGQLGHSQDSQYTQACVPALQ